MFVRVTVPVYVNVGVDVLLYVGVTVRVSVPVHVFVIIAVFVRVGVPVNVLVITKVFVGVAVRVLVNVFVKTGVFVAVTDAPSNLILSISTVQSLSQLAANPMKSITVCPASINTDNGTRTVFQVVVIEPPSTIYVGSTCTVFVQFILTNN